MVRGCRLRAHRKTLISPCSERAMPLSGLSQAPIRGLSRVIGTVQVGHAIVSWNWPLTQSLMYWLAVLYVTDR